MAATRRPGSRDGRSTTSASSTGSAALNSGIITQGAVPRSEREDRRLRQRRQHRAGAHRRRPDGHPRGLSLRAAARTAAAGWRRRRSSTTAPIYDDVPDGDIHVRYHCFSMRERLIKANGHADNHVMLTEDRRTWGDSSRSPVLREALSQMDQWLTALSEDTSGDPDDRQGPPGEAGRPGGRVLDARRQRRRRSSRSRRYGSGRCEAALSGRNSFPRGVAGAPLAADIIKCQLKPIDPPDYKVSFAAEDMARLTAIFPGGVCDWSKPGVEQQPPSGVWQRFSARVVRSPSCIGCSRIRSTPANFSERERCEAKHRLQQRRRAVIRNWTAGMTTT